MLNCPRSEVNSSGAVRDRLIVGSRTVRVSDWLSLPTALAAVMMTVETPGDAGVPRMVPVTASTSRPAGNPVARNAFGVLLAVIW